MDQFELVVLICSGFESEPMPKSLPFNIVFGAGGVAPGIFPAISRNNLLKSPPNQKGAVQIELPLMIVASKMPLLIFVLLPANLAEQKSKKIAQTFQKAPDNLMQCFKSSRMHVNFFHGGLVLIVIGISDR